MTTGPGAMSTRSPTPGKRAATRRPRSLAEFPPRRYPVIGWISLIVVIGLWQVAAQVEHDAILLPRPGEVLAAIVEMARSGELLRHMAASARRLGAGWCIGAAAGAMTGLAIGLFPIVRAAVLPLVTALFAMPKIALLPIFIVWLGIGEASKIITVAVGVFSPMAVATYAGLDAVDRNLIRMALSFDLPTGGIVRKILLPGALPSLLTGVRMSVSIAIVLLVGAEMIAAQYGLGALALTSGGLMRTDRMFAAVALLGLGGLGLSWTIGIAERILLRWR